MRFALRVSGCLAALAIACSLSSTAGVAWAQDALANVEEVAKAAVAEEAGEAGPNPLAIDPDLAIWTLVVFLVMFAILKTFAWPQIAAAVDERERKIAATIADADARLEDAKRILAEHDAKLAATSGEIRTMLDEARRDADVTKRTASKKRAAKLLPTKSPARSARSIGPKTRRCRTWRSPVQIWRSNWGKRSSATSCRYRPSIKPASSAMPCRSSLRRRRTRTDREVNWNDGRLEDWR